MGCGSSISILVPAAKWSKQQIQTKNIAFPSTGGLQLQLQQDKLRDNFRLFVYLHWSPSFRGSSTYFKSNAKAIAVNCLDFWIDVKDFSKIKSSSFQIYRACFIFEKYLMHGAVKQIPVSINVLDECANILFGGTSDEDVDCNLFSFAENEALDFLVAEVYPSFEKSSLSQPIRNPNKELLHVIRGGLVRRRASYFNSPDKEVLVRIMHKILSDSEYMAVFKTHLSRTRAERVLFAYNEAVELGEKLSGLSKVVDEEVRQTIFLHTVNGYYQAYMAMGAPFRICFTEATRGDLMRRIHSVGAGRDSEQEVLLPAVHEMFDCLLRDHLESFLSTQEYRQLVRSGRRSVLMLFTSSNNKLAGLQERAYSVSRLHTAASRGEQDGAATSSDDEEEDSEDVNEEEEGPPNHEVGPIMGTPLLVSTAMRELRNFLRSGYDGVFGRYLQQRGKLSLMLFYQSATRFSGAYFRHDVERVSECALIFERYISRNADEQVELPAHIRLSIVKQLFRAPQQLYAAAADWAIHHLCDQHWVQFTVEVNADSNGNRNDNMLTLGSAVITCADESFVGKFGAGVDGSERMVSASSAFASDNSLNSCSQQQQLSTGTGLRRKSNSPGKCSHQQPIAAPYGDDADQITAVLEFATLAAKKFPVRLQTGLGGDSATLRYFGDRDSFIPPTSPSHVLQTSRRHLSNIVEPTTPSLQQQAAASSSTKNLFTSTSARSGAGLPSKNSPSAKSKSSHSILQGARSLGSGKETASHFNAALLSRVDRKAPSSSAREVLEHPHCCSVFKAFLDSEGVAQTLLFFVEVEEFRRIPHVAFQTSRARKINVKYLHDLAVMPVPVSTAVKSEVAAHIADKSVLPTLFQAASDEVLRYIEIFQFPRFQQSGDFMSVLAILAKEGQLAGRHSPVKRRSSSLVIRASAMSDLQSLREILQHQLPTRYFKDFCVRTVCCENILFWLDVENYLHLPGSDYMRRVACKIYKKYVADEAKMQVNVSYATRQDIFDNLMGGQRLLFKKAQNEVFQLMQDDTMPKFIRSPEYVLLNKCMMETDKQFARCEAAEDAKRSPVAKLRWTEKPRSSQE